MALLNCAKRLFLADALAGVRGMAIAPAKLPDLPYDFSSLEPYISGKVGAEGSIAALIPLSDTRIRNRSWRST